ncbi:MAG: LLM class flavin-dependent oxidoreductase [Dehalococcoidia bacterium]
MSIRIGMGVAGFPFSGPEAFLRWIDLCEQSPIDSVWFSERLVSPVPNLEPIAVMALVAGRTKRLKFGMNAIVLPFRDPLVLAKECATLDYLSGGRLLPAFGVGAEIAPEFRATGREPVGRGSYSDEIIEIMTRLWQEEHVTYEGQHFNYRDMTISPRPKQQPLPVWIGGSSPAAIRRTARLGTGWLAGLQSPAQCAPVVASIRKEALEHGRTIDDDHYGAGFTFRFGAWDELLVERAAAQFARVPGGPEPRSYMAVGTATDIAARAAEYVEAGISKFVLRPVAGSDEEWMQQTQRLIEEVIPLVHS